MLTEIYNWFTEGFDTADLKDAMALLDQLNQSQFKSRFLDCDRKKAGDWGRSTETPGGERVRPAVLGLRERP
jgi:hypothetical protein